MVACCSNSSSGGGSQTSNTRSWAEGEPAAAAAAEHAPHSCCTRQPARERPRQQQPGLLLATLWQMDFGICLPTADCWRTMVSGQSLPGARGGKGCQGWPLGLPAAPPTGLY